MDLTTSSSSDTAGSAQHTDEDEEPKPQADRDAESLERQANSHAAAAAGNQDAAEQDVNMESRRPPVQATTQDNEAAPHEEPDKASMNGDAPAESAAKPG